MSHEDVNLGILDGHVPHAEINRSLAAADRVILFGQQTRLPHFPDDHRLPRLHAADPLVLFFWRVLKKVPAFLRKALVEGPVSITLVRGGGLLHYRDVRFHQSVHIGRRRCTIYLPEILLHEAEDKGYNHWSIAEGVIYASWMLLDYLLLVDVLTSFGEKSGFGQQSQAGEQRRAGNGNGPARGSGRLRLTEPLLRHLALQHNRHRRTHPEAGRSEVEEFIEGYRAALIRVQGVNTWTREPWEIARDVFDPVREQRWAQSKMERIADLFDYPRMFLFDRDIIHGTAHDLARRQGQSVEAASFADALHDYRDALRFEPRPLMTEFCKGIVPKPRAVFLTAILDLGAASLRDFFHAYRDEVPEAHDLIHALWSYLVSLSSDPAGVYTRVGRCRALCRPPGARIAGARRTRAASDADTAPALESGDISTQLDRQLAGILVRLDRRPDYRRQTAEVAQLGDGARAELLELIGQQALSESDEWATFKMKKQAIVTCACELLDIMDGVGGSEGDGAQPSDRRRVHEDASIQALLGDQPHRLTSDPSAVLMYVRSYRRTMTEYSIADPDSNFQLASILVRLDQYEGYEDLVARIPSLGPPAVSALYEVLEQIPERDERRRPILQRARRLLGSILLERQLRSRARQQALPLAQVTPTSASPTEGDGPRPRDRDRADGFVGLQRELLTGTAFLQRGADEADADADDSGDPE